MSQTHTKRNHCKMRSSLQPVNLLCLSKITFFIQFSLLGSDIKDPFLKAAYDGDDF